MNAISCINHVKSHQTLLVKLEGGLWMSTGLFYIGKSYLIGFKFCLLLLISEEKIFCVYGVTKAKSY